MLGIGIVFIVVGLSMSLEIEEEKVVIERNNAVEKEVVLGVGVSGEVSLNRASKEELESLPKIGPKLADRIIEYREKNGGFRNVEEIKLVSGIGEKMYEAIKNRISL